MPRHILFPVWSISCNHTHLLFLSYHEKFLFTIVVLLYFVTNFIVNVLSFDFAFPNNYQAVFILSGLILTTLLQYATIFEVFLCV